MIKESGRVREGGSEKQGLGDEGSQFSAKTDLGKGQGGTAVGGLKMRGGSNQKPRGEIKKT